MELSRYDVDYATHNLNLPADALRLDHPTSDGGTCVAVLLPGWIDLVGLFVDLGSHVSVATLHELLGDLVVDEGTKNDELLFVFPNTRVVDTADGDDENELNEDDDSDPDADDDEDAETPITA